MLKENSTFAYEGKKAEDEKRERFLWQENDLRHTIYYKKLGARLRLFSMAFTAA